MFRSYLRMRPNRVGGLLCTRRRFVRHNVFQPKPARVSSMDDVPEQGDMAIKLTRANKFLSAALPGTTHQPPAPALWAHTCR